MKVVYILFSSYSNGVEDWSSVVDVYADETEAELAKLALDEANDNINRQSWYISGWPVK